MIDSDSILPLVNGLLIAGGHGRRAGGPKALIALQDRLLWRVQVERLLAAGCRSVVAVLHPLALPAEAPTGVTLARADPDAPMFVSVQAGLRALAGVEPAPTLVLPVDCPMPGASVSAALLTAAQDAEPGGWRVIRPRYEGRHGHPLLLAQEFTAALLTKDGSRYRLDRLIAGLPRGQALSIDVADAAILANFNRDGLTV